MFNFSRHKLCEKKHILFHILQETKYVEKTKLFMHILFLFKLIKIHQT
jgi:hypothetical protein